MSAAEVGFMVFIALIAIIALGIGAWALYKVDHMTVANNPNTDILWWNSGPGGNFTANSYLGWGNVYADNVQSSIILNNGGMLSNFTIGIDPGSKNTTNSFTFNLLINGKSMTTLVLNGTTTSSTNFTANVNAGDLIAVQVSNPSNLPNFGMDTLMASVTFTPSQ